MSDKNILDAPIIKEFEPRSIFGITDTYPNDILEGLSPNRLYPVHVTHWWDPIDLFISLRSTYDRVHSSHGGLLKNMQKWYDRYEFDEKVKDLKPGSAVVFKHDGQWQRGLVILHPEGGHDALVRFADRGNQKLVELEDMKPLLDIFAIPPAAINVRLYGVQQRELTSKLMDNAKLHFKRLGKDYACRFVDVNQIWSLSHRDFKPRVELYELSRFDDMVKNSPNVVASLDTQFKPEPGEDLVARSKLFKLQRGNWKNYVHFSKHRKPKKKWYDEEPFEELEVNEDGLVFCCDMWLPPGPPLPPFSDEEA